MVIAERALSPHRVYRARPTIQVGDRTYPYTSKLVLALRITEAEGGMSALELRFSQIASERGGGARLAFEDGQILKLGASISVHLGDEEDQQDELFRGRITALEAEFSHTAPELVVFAEDALQRARMNRRTEVHRDTTLRAVAEDVARRAGLTPVVSGFDGNIGTHVQLNESDLAFLRRLLLSYDGDLQVVGRELHVLPRSDARRDNLVLELHSQLSWARVTADLADQTTEVSTAGWDPERGQRVSATSRGKSLGPGRGRRGSEVLEATLGARREHVGHVAVLTEQDARAMGDAIFDRRARRFVTLEGTAEGNPALRVGTHVEIRQVSPRFDNTYYVTKACHRFDVQLGELSGGYHTDFEAECAFLGADG